jgi:molybdenum cofactor cytidylyltransferase
MKIAAMILAAGSSSRMGQPKQMLDIHGEKLLVKTIKTFLDGGISKLVVVLGSNEEAHRDIIKDLPVEVTRNPNWKSGMGSSIKTGLQHLTQKHPLIEAVVVSVCDQPLLSKETISSLMNRYDETGKPIIASGYSDIPGVPVLFHRSYFPKLAKVPDNHGAKKVIMQNSSDVSVIPFPGGEIDLDTMEDYDRFISA